MHTLTTMASLSLTLAALGTSAVPGLVAVAVRPHHASGDDYAAAVLTTPDDEVIVSVPRTQQAEIIQSASVLGIAALTDGARAELPFAAPRALGMTRAGETRAVATTYLPGSRFDATDLAADALLIDSIADTLAAIHSLPRSVAQQGGLEERTARDQRLLTTRMVDRAQATRYLPQTVHARWTEVLEAQELWDFEPRMVHGTFGADVLLVEDDHVTGVLDWSGLSVGDPATDLAWLLESGDDVFDAVATRYSARSGALDSAALRSRATLYHELEIAKWLLHGVDVHDEEIIGDAVNMLDRLVDRLSILAKRVPNRGPLGEAEAIEMLEHTPEVDSQFSETAAYEALDEGRVFSFDTDFIEPLPRNDGARSGSADAAQDDLEGTSENITEALAPEESIFSASPGDRADPAAEQITEPIGDLPTEQLGDEDLPPLPRT